jgi:hypothetical protein
MWILHILVALNGISVGLRISDILHVIADDIIGYIHVVALGVKIFIQKRYRLNIPILICALMGSIFPDKIIFLRTLSLLSLISDDCVGGTVVRLWRRTVSLTAWVFFVIISFSWMTVLVLILLFDFNSSNTWIFTKPNDPLYFDLQKYFGTCIASLLSVLQIVTLDHYMSQIIRPVISIYPQLFIFFTSVQIITAFGLVYVAAGLVVRENMLMSAERETLRDKNHGKESLLIQLKIQFLVRKLKRLETKLIDMKPVSDRCSLFN